MSVFKSRAVVREVDRGWKALKRTLDNVRLREAYVRAGVIGPPAAASHGKNYTNIEIALVHEFGTDTIPERSFVRGSFEQHRHEYNSLLRVLLPRIYETRMTPAQVLGLLGARMANDMKAGIKAGIMPPNAPSVVARKLAKTYAGAAAGEPKPLIDDTGQLLNSLTWAVTVNGKTEQKGSKSAGTVPKAPARPRARTTKKTFLSQVKATARTYKFSGMARGADGRFKGRKK